MKEEGYQKMNDEGEGVAPNFNDSDGDNDRETSQYFKEAYPALREDEGEHNFSEIFIHQLIETIEFVLGGISNTASYLRLWALSLAHSQLAGVFYKMVFAGQMKSHSFLAPLFVVCAYAVFASATFGVLMFMDVMECFLHTLRLHWVEFQGKFFHGTGYLFTPLEFEPILEDEEESYD